MQSFYSGLKVSGALPVGQGVVIFSCVSDQRRELVSSDVSAGPRWPCWKTMYVVVRFFSCHYKSVPTCHGLCHATESPAELLSCPLHEHKTPETWSKNTWGLNRGLLFDDSVWWGLPDDLHVVRHPSLSQDSQVIGCYTPSWRVPPGNPPVGCHQMIEGTVARVFFLSCPFCEIFSFY